MKYILTFKIENASKNIGKCLSQMMTSIATNYKTSLPRAGLQIKTSAKRESSFKWKNPQVLFPDCRKRVRQPNFRFVGTPSI